MADPRLLGENDRPLLWDLDGTIVDTRRDIASGVNGLLSELALPPLTLDSVTRKVGKGVRNLVGLSLEESGSPANDEESLTRSVERFREHYSRHLLDTTAPYGNLAGLLRTLRDRGRAMAVVSNKPEDLSRAILRHLGLEDCFAVVLGGDSLPTRKPDPQPLLRALEACRAGRPGGTGRANSVTDAVLIGDSVIDLQAARAAGMPICAVAWGYDPEQRLRESAPDWWAETPEMLAGWLLGDRAT